MDHSGIGGLQRAGRTSRGPSRGLGETADKGPDFEDKIAAIGVRVRRWVSFHGIAINIEPDLAHFAAIVPCGVSDPRYGVTSLADLGHLVSMAEVDIALRQAFEEVFGSASMRVSDAMM